jgi:CHAT domain-containing protein
LAFFGAGLDRFVLSLILAGWCASANAAANESDWVNPEFWPYTTELLNSSSDDVLVLVEQAGIDLRVNLPGGESINSPTGARGPEFILLPPESELRIELEPISGEFRGGAFRISTLELADKFARSRASALYHAGLGFGASGSANVSEACLIYESLSANSEQSPSWKLALTQLAVACNHFTARANSTSLLEGLFPASDWFLSIPPYYSKWLQASEARLNDQYLKSTELHEELLAAALEADSDNKPPITARQSDLGEIHSSLGAAAMMSGWTLGSEDGSSHLQMSEENLRQAIGIANTIDHPGILGHAYDNLAGLNFVLGNEGAILDYLLLAKTALERAGDDIKLISVLGSIGDYHKDWGETRAALKAYHTAIDLISGRDLNSRYYDAWHNIGRLYFDLGDLERAREATEAAANYAQSAGRIWRQHVISIQLAEIMVAQGDFEEAQLLNRDLLAYFSEQGWTPFRINAQAYLSRSERLLGNHNTAYALSEEVMGILRQGNNGAGIDFANIYRNHAELLFASGSSDAAFEVIESALSDHVSDPVEVIDLLATKVQFHQKLGNSRLAIRDADQVFALIESQQVQLETARLGPLWSGRIHRIFLSHIQYLLNQAPAEQYLARVFDLAEQAEATSLRLRRQQLAQENNEFNSAARQEWIALQKELQQRQASIRSEADSLEFERYLTNAREKFLSEHGINTDDLDIETLMIADIQGNLDELEIVSKFIIAEQEAWRIDITQSSTAMVRLGSKELLSALIDAALFELSNPNTRNPENSQILSEMLLARFPDIDEHSTLLISTSGDIGLVPFTALKLGEQELGEILTVTLTPNLSEYFAAHNPEHNDSELEFAILADPAFDQTMQLSSFEKSVSGLRSWSGNLGRLPYSAQEAQEIGNLFPANEKLVLTGENATQSNFFGDEFRNANIIHLATHGYFNESLPELIGFATARSGANDDGFVSMAEISASRFNASLVVVSACDTSRGQNIPGEGAMSLSRTFLAQGADSVVSTLWPISDAATATFMREFYRGIRELGHTLPQAMQHAQNELKAIPRFSNPFYWAAYVLTSVNRNSLDLY